MTNRRKFLQDAAAMGVLFTGCALTQRRARAQAASKRRVVTVGGQRIRTIDVHAHVIVPEATELMGVKTAATNSSVIGPETSSARFNAMDEWGTDLQALSINANWYGVDQAVATKMMDVQNQA